MLKNFIVEKRMFGSRFYLNKLRQIRVECYNSLHSALLVLGLVLAVQKGEIGVAIFFRKLHVFTQISPKQLDLYYI